MAVKVLFEVPDGRGVLVVLAGVLGLADAIRNLRQLPSRQ